MNASSASGYWEKRGRRSYCFRGERFYTVTPIVYYYHRRRRLLALLEQVVAAAGIRSVCDFGCGDGYYVAHLAKQFPSKEIAGFDPSSSMISAARERYESDHFEHSADGIPFDRRFDLIYAVAVLAHIVEDDALSDAMSDIRQHVRPGGILVLFESFAQKERRGRTWCRRTLKDYELLARAHGFEPKSFVRLSYPIFAVFEKFLYPRMLNLALAHVTSDERGARANGLRLFRAAQWIALCVDRVMHPFIRRPKEGNAFMVFERVDSDEAPTRESANPHPSERA